MSIQKKQVDLVESTLLTLERVYSDGLSFSIPSYQRPYVWSDDAVLKLFDDISSACFSEPSSDSYFIGTVLTSKKNTANNQITYELIDGQQRTTTLMLIASAFRSVDENLLISGAASHRGSPRLSFNIREQVQQLLGSLAGLEGYIKPSDDVIDDNPYLKRINAALVVLEQRIDGLENNKRIKLADFLFSKVQWVNNIVPENMDLNNLFTTMNTAGLQLEQSDILKSRLLSKITSDHFMYEAVWSACEYQENYFEQNVKQLFPFAPTNYQMLSTFSPTYWKEDEQNLARISKAFTMRQLYSELFFSDVNNGEETAISDKINTIKVIDDAKVYCRPIINFNLLLIHAYRIHLAIKGSSDITPRLHADKLLEIFEPLCESDNSEVKTFLECLWQVRYQFDKWVVKWVERNDEKEEKLSLTSINQQGAYLTRGISESSELSMLQSVLNFTGDRSAQYWLTPFIKSLICEQDKSGGVSMPFAIKRLEYLDNSLSLSLKTQKEASYYLSQNKQTLIDRSTSTIKYLLKPYGTKFRHYWFQKLEYVLWKESKVAIGNSNDDSKFKGYKITSKNSVEHVHPRNEKYENKLEKKYSDSFGNLALLSPNENSSYGHQPVSIKSRMFEGKSNMNNAYESLKLKEMFKIYEDEKTWGKDQILRHRNSMIKKLIIHYGEVIK